MEYVAAALLGFAGGTLGGLVGVGGGILFVPALAIFLDQSQVRAEATSLLAIVFVAMLGAWRQHGYGNVRVRDGLVLGVALAARRGRRRRDLERGLRAHPRALLRALALVVAAQLVRRALRPSTATASRSEPVLEGALDRGVERVQPVERQRLGRGEAAAAEPRPASPAGPGVGPVVGEHAVEQRQPALARRARRPRRATICAPIARWPSSRPSSLIPNSAP